MVLSRLVFSHPFLTISCSLLLSFILPIIILVLFPLQLGSNPEKGFETDGTPYAGARLGWTLLQPSLLRGSRVPFISADQQPNERWKRKSWTDELFSSVGSVACYDSAVPSMSFLSQFILTVPSLEHLFSRDILHKICSFQDKLKPELAVFQQFTPHRNIWSVPNYMACLSPSKRVNCSFIEDEDMFEFRQLFNRCLLHRRTIVSCRRHCQQHIHWAYNNAGPSANDCSVQSSGECAAVPAECDGQMWFDLFYRILPDDLSLVPLPINAFLPFYSFAAYRLQGFGVPLKYFIDIENKLKLISVRSEGVQLKGLSLETKRDLLLEATIRDSRFSLLAVLAVFFLLCFYSLSLAFALAVLLQMVASFLCSLAVYRLFSAEFPLLNLIALVLLISVGADGAFLLLDLFPATEKLCLGTLQCCLRHTAKTMFLTQFSTIVPFMLNILSSVFAFRSFGLFAGLTLIFNYLLLLFFLPSFLIIQNRHLTPWLIRWWPSRLWYCFPSSASHSSLGPPLEQEPSASSFSPSAVRFPTRVPSTWFGRFHHFLRVLIDDVLTAVLIQGRFVWLCSLGVVLFLSALVCVNDLSLPRYNPLQLFRSSNLHEFFDQNAERLFPFVSDKIAAFPLAVRLVWGIRPASVQFYFDANSVPNKLQFDHQFQLRTVGQLRALAQQLEQMRTLPFIEHTARFWPERFLEWSIRLNCAPSAVESICCNVQSPHFVTDQLDSCIRQSTSVLFTNYNDTLIWDNSTHSLVGYTALLPTHLRYSHRFANLSAAFALFDKWLSIGSQVSFLPGWYTTEWAAMSQWFDLQRAIISDCKQSICVSFVVVFLFSSLMLRLKAFCATFTIFCIVLTTIGALVFLGWEIGVLEGAIIVLAVGLSFDYTLHFGALVPSDGCAEHKLQKAVRGAARPVGMAALSSILAGGVILLSETHAFYQVSLFLVICSFTSFLFALFFFLPLVSIFHASNRSAEPSEKGSAIRRCKRCFQLRCKGHFKQCDG